MWDFFFFLSIVLNFILFFNIQTLRGQIRAYKHFKRKWDQPIYTTPAQATEEQSLSPLEIELDNEINLPELVPRVDSYTAEPDTAEQHKVEAPQPPSKESRLASVLQSISGWHHSFIPFLLQNIGWFIGILCFMSGSIFFVSYTQGFSKSLTITYTILSYTLLLAWGGYSLKEKVTHANTSGMILLAISFLLIPLNFTALARLLSISLDDGLISFAFIISACSIVIASALLFYVSKLISGLFNRHLLAYFSDLFFTISALQLLIPLVVYQSNISILLILFSIILFLLLFALAFYLPTLLQQVFVDKKYLVLFSVGSLLFATLVSIIHIGISSPISIPLSFYAPFVLLISMLLFYMDEQLHNYKQQGGLLSYFSLICYALSFVALVLAFESSFIRLLCSVLAILLYARLMWIYRSLAPLYLVLILMALLYCDLFLVRHNFMLIRSLQYLYISILPLLLFYSALFFILIQNINEPKREKSLQLTRHLLHTLLITSIVSGIVSQWMLQIPLLAVFNSSVLLLNLYYFLMSEKVMAVTLLGLKYHLLYIYWLTLLVGFLLLSNPLIRLDIQLTLFTLVILFYTLNSHYQWFQKKGIEREVFINSSLLLSLFLLLLVAIGFSVSIKIALLIFILALNSLFLSLSLYNRALFYSFMLLLALSVLILKLYLNTAPSSGLMLSSMTLILFFVLYLLDKNKKTELEIEHLTIIRCKPPEKLLWFYPVNDFKALNSNKEGV